MTIQELKAWAATLPDDSAVMILDGFNGGGTPRDINFKAEQTISSGRPCITTDCEGRVGEQVFVLGFGCY